METAFLITAFVTLFVVVDPIGLAPMFVALTKGVAPRERRAIAIRACVAAALLLTLFGLGGESVLNFVGISMPAFRITGGVLLFLTAMDMLFERRSERRKGKTDVADDPSIFPLATPLIAGPGSMATMILLMGQAENTVSMLLVHVAMVSVVILVLLMCFSANLFERLLGETGINVMTRLMGMLLAALSVQFILDGLAAFGIGAGLI